MGLLAALCEKKEVSDWEEKIAALLFVHDEEGLLPFIEPPQQEHIRAMLVWLLNVEPHISNIIAAEIICRP